MPQPMSSSLVFQTSSGTLTGAIPKTSSVLRLEGKKIRAASDPLGVVARALDEPVGSAPLASRAKNIQSVAIIIPDRTRPAAAHTYLLPLLARLALAGVHPQRIRIVVARGIHTTSSRDDVRRLVGNEIMDTLRPVQSAPDTPESNVSIGTDAELGDVRVHRSVAESDLVILTGAVTPHHLTGFGGGPKALVPGVAERKTVVAAHRLTLDAIVQPNGSIVTSGLDGSSNRFRKALHRATALLPNTFLLNVILNDSDHIADAVAGSIEEAHTEAIARWKALHAMPLPEGFDCVVVHTPPPVDGDLIQAHKCLLRAAAWAKPGAPLIWTADAPNGPGHPMFLPWFESGKLHRHLAALRDKFHPYGLTAYSVRRLAKDHPIHVVSSLSRDILRPMGLLAFDELQPAIDFAWSEAQEAPQRVLVMPNGGL